MRADDKKPVASVADLDTVERLFLRLWCFPPPAKPYEPRDTLDTSNPPPLSKDPLQHARTVFGKELEDAIKGHVFADIGCGPGDQVIGAAMLGARLAVGIDEIEIGLKAGETNAKLAGVSDRVRLTTDAVSTFGTEWADVILSQNSFEHFGNPDAIMQQAYAALKPGGKFFITFNPPWWHPYGVHNMFMIRMPWAHVVFSCKTILRVRQLYRPNKPESWSEVGLNQMTIQKFLSVIDRSSFPMADLVLRPIGPLPKFLARSKLCREWLISNVSVVLTKPLK